MVDNKNGKKKEPKKESEELEEPIRACMNCGHNELDYIGKDASESAVLFLGSPLTGIYRCRNCGFEGAPLEFYTEEDRAEFLKMKEEKGEIGREQELIQKQSPTAGRMYWAYFKTGLVALGIGMLIILAFLVLTFIFGRG